jgi:tRNA (guanine10-N2)-dimethyltransferase
MMDVWVEPSGESPALAEEEIRSAAEAVGGGASGTSDPEGDYALIPVSVPDRAAARSLAARLALARRCLRRLGADREGLEELREAGRRGEGGAVRRLGRPHGGGADAMVARAGAEYVRGGGRIDLEAPARRFWLRENAGATEFFEEIAPVDRSDLERRRMPSLPFQRPVSVSPRLARAAANLARIRPGDRVLDPFLGTGALLAEAGLLGARIFGIDRDPEMVRGALRNLAHLGLEAEEIRVGDASGVEPEWTRGALDAVLTDAPYGRSSGTGGEEAAAVVARVVPRWADRVRAGGRVVLVTPGGYEPMRDPWVCRIRVPVRVHRSLTREFRVYERGDAPRGSAVSSSSAGT